MAEGRPPLVPAGCDLGNLQWFPLDVDRLLGSQFHATADDAAWRAGVTLWLRAWRQVPAASLPADDVALARLAELGRDLRTWRRVRAAALRGWVLCSDGRLYHPLIAERALAAWIGRLQEQRRSALGNRRRWGGAVSLGQVDAQLEAARVAQLALGGVRRTKAPAAADAAPGGLFEGPAGNPAGSPDGTAPSWGTEAGQLAKALRVVGVRVASTDPVLLGWVADGFGEARVLEAVEATRLYKPAPEVIPARYLDRVLRSVDRGTGNGGKGRTDRDEARRRRVEALTGQGAGGGSVIDGDFAAGGAAAD